LYSVRRAVGNSFLLTAKPETVGGAIVEPKKFVFRCRNAAALTKVDAARRTEIPARGSH
jgi:hypothetical protein